MSTTAPTYVLANRLDMLDIADGIRTLAGTEGQLTFNEFKTNLEDASKKIAPFTEVICGTWIPTSTAVEGFELPKTDNLLAVYVINSTLWNAEEDTRNIMLVIHSTAQNVGYLSSGVLNICAYEKADFGNSAISMFFIENGIFKRKSTSGLYWNSGSTYWYACLYGKKEV